MIRPPIVYSGQHAERRYAADQLAREVGVQPSVADWWLWMKWCVVNRLWDGYHVAPGRCITFANQEKDCRDSFH